MMGAWVGEGMSLFSLAFFPSCTKNNAVEKSGVFFRRWDDLMHAEFVQHFLGCAAATPASFLRKIYRAG
jgi:hypothetical protein